MNRMSRRNMQFKSVMKELNCYNNYLYDIRNVYKDIGIRHIIKIVNTANNRFHSNSKKRKGRRSKKRKKTRRTPKRKTRNKCIRLAQISFEKKVREKRLQTYKSRRTIKGRDIIISRMEKMRKHARHKILWERRLRI